jgi:hypothetical protein
MVLGRSTRTKLKALREGIEDFILGLMTLD